MSQKKEPPPADKVPAAPREGRGQGRRRYAHRFDQNAPKITRDVQREICKRIAEGATMKQIESDERMPRRQHIYHLLWRDAEFKRMYHDARAARAAVRAEELSELAAKAADLGGLDAKKSMAHVQAIRLQVDTDKWLLSKILPREYGDELPDKGDKRSQVGDVLEIVRAVAQLARDKPLRAEVVIPTIQDRSVK